MVGLPSVARLYRGIDDAISTEEVTTTR
jgi:hypothetical protein